MTPKVVMALDPRQSPHETFAEVREDRVAILCLDDDKFLSYAGAARAQYPSDVIVIASRDDTERLRYSGKRVILSTPEYVAGLQFAAVVLADANKDLVPDKGNSSLELRRHLSELHLGISRAQKLLYVLADEEAGGMSDSLKRCGHGST